jgi:hypothetical protein
MAFFTQIKIKRRTKVRKDAKYLFSLYGLKFDLLAVSLTIGAFLYLYLFSQNRLTRYQNAD